MRAERKLQDCLEPPFKAWLPRALCIVGLILFAHETLADLPVEPSNLPINDTTNFLVTVQYFWDSPTNGVVSFNASSNESLAIGDPLSIPVNVVVTQLTAGLHQLGITVLNAAGRWSETNWVPLLVLDGASLPPVASPPINDSARLFAAAEYFWDTPTNTIPFNVPTNETFAIGDPNGFPFNVGVTQLTAGLHQLGLSAQDASGRWSETNWVPLLVLDGASLPPVASPPINDSARLFAAAEYFWDAPTNPAPFNVPTNQTFAIGDPSGVPFNVGVTQLNAGLHQLGLAAQDASGRWSETNWVPLLVLDAASLPPVFVPPISDAANLLVSAEYFWDIDPGTNNGAVISLPAGESWAPGSSAVSDLNLSVPNLPLDLHYLGLRAKTAAGIWTPTERIGLILERPTHFTLLNTTNMLTVTNLSSINTPVISCPGTNALCPNTYDLSVQTTYLLRVNFTHSSNDCSDIRMHFLLDGQERTNSVRLGPGASSGWFELGPVSRGTHLLQLQSEGFIGGCNVGTTNWWSGTLQLATTVEVTNVAGGDFPHSAGASTGIAAGDYDVNGYPDLFVANQDQSGILFQNQQAGIFWRTNSLPSQGPATSQTAVWGDYDNDGFADLFVAVQSRSASSRNLLYHNLGGTNFELVSTSVLNSAETNSMGCAWVDVDGDGLLDLAVASTTRGKIGLYHNNGGTNFTDISDAAALNCGSAFCVAFADFENTRRPGLIATGPGGVHLFRNLGGNNFVEVSNSFLAPDPTAVSAAWGDFDNDGWPDLFITSTTHFGVLYRNNHNGTFTQIQPEVFNRPGLYGAGCVWADFDQDGRLDLFVSCQSSNTGNQLFRNNSDGTFTPMVGIGASLPGTYVGCAWADIDRNGTPDLLVANFGGDELLYQNIGSGANWLQVKLTGRSSNRSAISAKVTAQAIIDGANVSQLREISGGNGYASQNELTANFGLGNATNVDFVTVEWPSGLIMVLTNVSPNTNLALLELPPGKPVIRVNGEFSPNNQFTYITHDPVTVTMDSSFELPEIHYDYTTNNAEPNPSFLTSRYIAPFMVSPPARIKAFAFDRSSFDEAFSDTVELIFVPTNSVTDLTPGGGYVTLVPPGGSYLSNTTITVTATNWPGWSFLHWAGDLSGTSPTTNLIVNGPKSFSAIFGTTNFAAAARGGATNGSLTQFPSNGPYAYGLLVRLSAIPAPGKYFYQWVWASTNNVVLTDDPMDWPVTNAATSFSALFFDLPTNRYSLTTLINGEGSVTRNIDDFYYTNGTTLALTAIPTNDQFFIGWSGDATGAQNPLTIVMNTNKIITATFAVIPPLFSFGSNAYTVNEADPMVSLIVSNNGVGGMVTYSTLDGTALGGDGTYGDYVTAQNTLIFTNGERSKSISIGIRDNFLVGPDKTFQVQLTNASGGSGSLGTPAATTVTIRYNDNPTNPLVRALPSTAPARSGVLRVTISPPEAAGQWRFDWEDGWRNSGQLVSNLVAANYEIEFRPIDGWNRAASSMIVAVTTNGITEAPTQYYPAGASGTGSLTVNLGPDAVVTNAGWHFVGADDINFWRTSGSTASNRAVGSYLIEYQPVQGWAAPSRRAVDIFAGQTSMVSDYYVLASEPQGVALPVPLASFNYINSSLTDNPQMPFAFNGQLHSELGYGSGVAVRSNVVLTAAHVVFNDQTLSFVNNLDWFFQRQAGEFDPPPLKVRGGYILAGYAAARTNGIVVPGQSTPESRYWDAAALFFYQAAARGGYAGYLASDAATNEWLTGSSLKLLAGYPMDGASYGYAGVVPGKMHQTPAINFTFTPLTNRVYGSAGFVSFPGNSGGALCVLYNLNASNSVFLPAAIYLGQVQTLSVVRSIDSNVVSLINHAAADGDRGENFITPGVVNFNVNDETFPYGYLKVNVSPAQAAGSARWHVKDRANVGSFTPQQVVAAISGTNWTYTIQFEAVPGYIAPADQATNLTLNVTNFVSGTYILAPTNTLGALRVNLTPAYAVSAGGKWLIVGNTNLYLSGQSVSLAPSNYSVAAIALTNFTTPTTVSATVTNGQTNTLTLQYQPIARLSATLSQGLTILAPSGATYFVQSEPALSTNQWTNLFSVTLTQPSHGFERKVLV